MARHALAGPNTRAGRAALAHARERRRRAQDARAFDTDADSPFDMGTVAAGSPLPTPYTMPANSRIAVSFSVGVTAGQLTVAVGSVAFGTPDLAADEVRRLGWAEKAKSATPTCAVAGTVTLYTLDEWQVARAIATGVFT